MVVLGTGALGSPVSMTQAIAGGLVGSAIDRGMGSIRWQTAAHLVAAWLVTLPSAFAAAALVTAATLGIPDPRRQERSSDRTMAAVRAQPHGTQR